MQGMFGKGLRANQGMDALIQIKVPALNRG